jgi:hypothetical protein
MLNLPIFIVVHFKGIFILTFDKFTAVNVEIYGCKYTNFTVINFGNSVKIGKNPDSLCAL